MGYELTKAKYPISALGTKPRLIKKTLDKTDLKPVIQDLFALARDITKLMSHHDQDNTGKALYSSILRANTHFALSYYHVGITEEKYNEAYKLVMELENIKFLLEEVFRLNMIRDSKQHVEGFRNRTYLVIADMQEQIDKWYNWIVAELQQRTQSTSN